MLKPNECYFVYGTDGRILYTVDHPAAPGTTECFDKNGLTYVAGTKVNSIVNYYVKDKAIVERPGLTAMWVTSATVPADDQTVAEFQTFPDVTVFVDNVPAGNTDENGKFQLTADTPGIFEIRLVQWPYFDAKLHLVAE